MRLFVRTASFCTLLLIAPLADFIVDQTCKPDELLGFGKVSGQRICPDLVRYPCLSSVACVLLESNGQHDPVSILASTKYVDLDLYSSIL